MLADDARAQRLLDLTGLTPDGLRDGITETQTHRAILDFLCQHEPDLIGAAEALEIAPEQLVAAARELHR
ncbi:DUF3572 family protein [Aurantiacibacter rhizosphaerae]|uniref:DUF3572 family protein n=1 Tax=Aurantiacibacter rhizosphaerae TaxID=2691582 RepID=UPI003B02C732